MNSETNSLSDASANTAGHARVQPAVITDLIAACRAALRYDAAIQSCANSPDTMASYCTAEGDDLDALYAEWIVLARTALHRAEASNG